MATNESFRSYFWTACPWVIGVSFLTLFLHHNGSLNRFESTAIDFATRLQEPLAPADVFIVKIDDADYRSIFQNRSPLDRARLKEIIKAVVARRPRVIGIDIDTSDPGDLMLSPEELGGVRLVWGQTVTQTKTGGKYVLEPIPVLGGQRPQPPLESIGIAVLPPLDADGRVRRYARRVPLVHRAADTLPWAVAKAFCLSVFDDPHPKSELLQRCEAILKSEKNAESDERYLLPFSSPVDSTNVSSLLQAAKSDLPGNFSLQGKAVILGGTFELSGDAHDTPSGEQKGIELVARAVETELQGRLIAPVNDWLMFFLEVLGGFILVCWHYFTHHWRKTWVMLTAQLVPIPILALVLSYAAFFSLAYWADFTLVLCSVFIHEALEHFKFHRKLVRLHATQPSPST